MTSRLVADSSSFERGSEKGMRKSSGSEPDATHAMIRLPRGKKNSSTGSLPLREGKRMTERLLHSLDRTKTENSLALGPPRRGETTAKETSTSKIRSTGKTRTSEEEHLSPIKNSYERRIESYYTSAFTGSCLWPKRIPVAPTAQAAYRTRRRLRYCKIQNFTVCQKSTRRKTITAIETSRNSKSSTASGGRKFGSSESI